MTEVAERPPVAAISLTGPTRRDRLGTSQPPLAHDRNRERWPSRATAELLDRPALVGT